MKPKKSDSRLSNYPSLGIKRFFVIFDKECKMVASRNLLDEIPESTLKSVLQDQAPKGAAAPWHDEEAVCQIRRPPLLTCIDRRLPPFALPS